MTSVSPSGETAATVYYDGDCPLCAAEIRHYSSRRGASALTFVDVAASDADPSADLGRAAAMKRFHARDAEGRLLSGAAAFVEIWRALPGWRWAARLADLPGALTALEGAYRGFLVIRPALSRAFGAINRFRRKAKRPV